MILNLYSPASDTVITFSSTASLFKVNVVTSDVAVPSLYKVAVTDDATSDGSCILNEGIVISNPLLVIVGAVNVGLVSPFTSVNVLVSLTISLPALCLTVTLMK